jgi:hypothetical protein
VVFSSAAPAALFTVYVEQERFEADYLWRLQPVNLAEHQQRYHNDALPDRAVDSFLCYSGSYWCSLLINRWRYWISNRCNILIKGTTFLELASTCFMLSSLQDVNASKKK